MSERIKDGSEGGVDLVVLQHPHEFVPEGTSMDLRYEFDKFGQVVLFSPPRCVAHYEGRDGEVVEVELAHPPLVDDE